MSDFNTPGYWDEVDAMATDIYELLGDINPYDPDADQNELDAAMDYVIECIGQERNPAIRLAAMRQLADLTDDMRESAISRGNPWMQVKDGDPRLMMVFKDHYSFRQPKGKRKNNLIIGPGYKLPLIVPHATQPHTGRPQAIFAWRLEKHRRDDEFGVCCAFFRNESTLLASDLIRYAEEHATLRWPYMLRFFTHINPRKVRPRMVRGTPTWGYVYEKAGWQLLAKHTKRNDLLRMEKTFDAPGWLFAWEYTHDPELAATHKRNQPRIRAKRQSNQLALL